MGEVISSGCSSPAIGTASLHFLLRFYYVMSVSGLVSHCRSYSYGIFSSSRSASMIWGMMGVSTDFTRIFARNPGFSMGQSADFRLLKVARKS